MTIKLRKIFHNIFMTEQPWLHALALACVFIGLYIPFTGTPFLLTPLAGKLLGIIGATYDQHGSDLYMYVHAGACWIHDIPVWTAQCNPEMISNLLPLPLLLVAPFAIMAQGTLLLYCLLPLSLYGALLLLPFQRNMLSAIIAASLILMPGFLLGLRSGNMEMICFFMVALGCFLESRSQKFSSLAAACLGLAASYKLFPALLFAMLRDRRVALAATILFATYLFVFHNLVVNALVMTVYGHDDSFGLPFHYGYINGIEKNWIWLAPTYLGFHKLMIHLYMLRPNAQWLYCIIAFIVTGLLTPIIVAAFFIGKNEPYYDYTKPKARFAIAGSLLIILIIGFFWSFSYRYWITFLIVPQLVTDIGNGHASFQRRCLAGFTLFAVYAGGLAQYSLQPIHEKLPETILPFSFSLQHVVGYYAELVLIVYAVFVTVNWFWLTWCRPVFTANTVESAAQHPPSPGVSA